MLERAFAATDLDLISYLKANPDARRRRWLRIQAWCGAYIATPPLPHGQPSRPKRAPLPSEADAKTRMAWKLRGKKRSAIYAHRKAMVERVNGQIKEASDLRSFLLPCLEQVNGEWHLIAATHNLLKLVRFQRSQQQALAAASG